MEHAARILIRTVVNVQAGFFTKTPMLPYKGCSTSMKSFSCFRRFPSYQSNLFGQPIQRKWSSSVTSQETMSVPSTPSTPTSPPPEPYEIRTITDSDTEPLLEHLRKFFFKDEPLNVAVKLIEFEDSTCIELEEYSVKSIKEGTSVMAVTKSGKIVGVCLNGTINRDDPEEDDEECPNPKFNKILKLLHACGSEGKRLTTKLYPDVEKVMFVKILSTDSEWRGRGIAKQLMDKTREIGRERGFGLMRVDCTSHYSARAIIRLGFDCIYQFNYDDWKVNGKSVFDLEYPHKALTIYVQRIAPDTPIIGHERGYGLMRVDCSSHYSARAIARLGFDKIYEMKYETWTENGEPAFKTAHPHNEFTIYVQKI